MRKNPMSDLTTLHFHDEDGLHDNNPDIAASSCRCPNCGRTTDTALENYISCESCGWAEYR